MSRFGGCAMPDAPRMVYWDSCIFLHDIEGREEWLPILDALLEEASTTADLVIVTSTLSICEVAFAEVERRDLALDPDIEANIDALWADRAAVQLVEFDQIIARSSRSLLRRHAETARSLKPLDAIHLATAQQMRVDDFHTTDDRLKNWNDLGFPVQDPWTPRPKLL